MLSKQSLANVQPQRSVCVCLCVCAGLARLPNSTPPPAARHSTMCTACSNQSEARRPTLLHESQGLKMLHVMYAGAELCT